MTHPAPSPQPPHDALASALSYSIGRLRLPTYIVEAGQPLSSFTAEPPDR